MAENINQKDLRDRLKQVNQTVDTKLEGKPAPAKPAKTPAAVAPSAPAAGAPTAPQPQVDVIGEKIKANQGLVDQFRAIRAGMARGDSAVGLQAKMQDLARAVAGALATDGTAVPQAEVESWLTAKLKVQTDPAVKAIGQEAIAKNPALADAPADPLSAQADVQSSSYKTYIEYEYVGEPGPDSAASMPSEEMNFTPGKANSRGEVALAPAIPGDARSNIEKVISGERTATSRKYAAKPGMAAGSELLLTVKGRPAAVVRIKAVYAIEGSSGGTAILRDTATGSRVKKPISEMAAAEGYDAAEYAKKIYGTDSVQPAQGAAEPATALSRIAGSQVESDTYLSAVKSRVQSAVNVLIPMAERWLKDQPETDFRGYLEYLAESHGDDPAVVEMLRAHTYLSRIHGAAPHPNVAEEIYVTRDGVEIDLGEDFRTLLASEDVGGKLWFVTDLFTLKPYVEDNRLFVDVLPGASGADDTFDGVIERVRPPRGAIEGSVAEPDSGPAMVERGVPVPAQGETTPSVAQIGLPGASTEGPTPPEIATTAATTPEQTALTPDQLGAMRGVPGEAQAPDEGPDPLFRGPDMTKTNVEPSPIAGGARAEARLKVIEKEKEIERVKKGRVAQQREFSAATTAAIDRLYALYATQMQGIQVSGETIRALDDVRDPVNRQRGRQATRSTFLHYMLGYVPMTDRLAAVRAKFDQVLVAAGIPQSAIDAVRSGPFASSRSGRPNPNGFRPNFSTADNPNGYKLSDAAEARIMDEIDQILSDLTVAGREGVLNHPDYAEGTGLLLRMITDLDRDITSGDSVTFNPTKSEGRNVYRFDSDPANIDPYIAQQIIDRTGVDPRTLRPNDIITVPVPAEKGQPAQLRRVLVRHLVGYTRSPVRHYSLDRLGLIDPRWVAIDSNGVNLPSAQHRFDLTGKGKAAISFQITTDSTPGEMVGEGKTVRNMGFEQDATRALRVYLASKIGQSMAIHSGDKPTSILGAMADDATGEREIILNRVMEYTDNQIDVDTTIDQIRSGLPQERMVLIQIPDTAGRILVSSGRVFEVDPTNNGVFVLSESDPAIAELKARFGASTSNPFRIGESIAYQDGYRVTFDVEPIVRPAVKHTIPLRKPDGFKFSAPYIPHTFITWDRKVQNGGQNNLVGENPDDGRRAIDPFIDDITGNYLNDEYDTGLTETDMPSAIVMDTGEASGYDKIGWIRLRPTDRIPIYILEDDYGRFPTFGRTMDSDTGHGWTIGDPVGDNPFSYMDRPRERGKISPEDMNRARAIMQDLETQTESGVPSSRAKVLTPQEEQLVAAAEENLGAKGIDQTKHIAESILREERARGIFRDTRYRPTDRGTTPYSADGAYEDSSSHFEVTERAKTDTEFVRVDSSYRDPYAAAGNTESQYLEPTDAERVAIGKLHQRLLFLLTRRATTANFASRNARKNPEQYKSDTEHVRLHADRLKRLLSFLDRNGLTEAEVQVWFDRARAETGIDGHAIPLIRVREYSSGSPISSSGRLGNQARLLDTKAFFYGVPSQTEEVAAEIYKIMARKYLLSRRARTVSTETPTGESIVASEASPMLAEDLGGQADVQAGVESAAAGADTASGIDVSTLTQDQLELIVSRGPAEVERLTAQIETEADPRMKEDLKSIVARNSALINSAKVRLARIKGPVADNLTEPNMRLIVKALQKLPIDQRSIAVRAAFKLYSFHVATDIDGEGIIKKTNSLLYADDLSKSLGHVLQDVGFFDVTEHLADRYGEMPRPYRKIGFTTRVLSDAEVNKLVSEAADPFAMNLKRLAQENNLTFFVEHKEGAEPRIFLAQQSDDIKGRINSGEDLVLSDEMRPFLPAEGAGQTISDFEDMLKKFGVSDVLSLETTETGNVVLKLNKDVLSTRTGVGPEKGWSDGVVDQYHSSGTISEQGKILVGMRLDAGIQANFMRTLHEAFVSAGLESPISPLEYDVDHIFNNMVRRATLEKGDSFSTAGVRAGKAGEDPIIDGPFHARRLLYSRRGHAPIDIAQSIISERVVPIEEAAMPGPLERAAGRLEVIKRAEAGLPLPTEEGAVGRKDPNLIRTGEVDENGVPIRRRPVTLPEAPAGMAVATPAERALYRKILHSVRMSKFNSKGGALLGGGVGGIGVGMLINNILSPGMSNEEQKTALAMETLGAIDPRLSSVANLAYTGMNHGDMLRALLNIAASFGGGAIGGAAGAVAGPLGSLAGGTAGSVAASTAANALYDTVSGAINGHQNVPVNLGVMQQTPMDTGRLPVEKSTTIDALNKLGANL